MVEHALRERPRWTAEPRPCFNPSLLADIRAYYEFVSQTHGVVHCEGEEHPIEYTVLASGIPGVFNLGGDLDLFKQLIGARDRARLLAEVGRTAEARQVAAEYLARDGSSPWAERLRAEIAGANAR